MRQWALIGIETQRTPPRSSPVASASLSADSSLPSWPPSANDDNDDRDDRTKQTPLRRTGAIGCGGGVVGGAQRHDAMCKDAIDKVFAGGAHGKRGEVQVIHQLLQRVDRVGGDKLVDAADLCAIKNRNEEKVVQILDCVRGRRAARR